MDAVASRSRTLADIIRRRPLLAAAAIASLVILGSCAAPDRRPGAPPGARTGGQYKIGLPYRINGTTYRPAVDYDYVETGIASWYGRKFHGRATANGEIFDMNAVSAAHRTLPLPSIVRVTNLKNGRSIVVRVNDRGPFVKSRIIDLSRRAAQVLGFRAKGLARVRVEIMAEQSRRAAAIAMGGVPPGPVMDARRTPLPNDLAIVRDPKPVRVAFIDASPLPATKRPARPGPAPAASGERAKRYYVQAGAFRDYANAVRLQSWLASMGEAAIVPSSADAPIYRVRFGPYADPADARGLLSAIVARGRPDARVVSD